MDKNLISVIMPAYNAENFIKEAVKSVLNQSYTNWELIIIDDGSTDSTAEIIKELGSLDSRIKYHYQIKGKARNLGIRNSRGKYIAFLDADDLWVEDKLLIEIDIINNHKEIDLIFSQGYNFLNSKVEDYDLIVKDTWDTKDFDSFLSKNQIPILSVLVKKESLTKVNNFSEESGIQNVEDYHLWLKLLLSGCIFKSIPNRLFYYRIHTNQSTYNSSNVDIPLLNAYIDIYHFTTTLAQKRGIINKIKWGVFAKDLHTKSIDLFSLHLKKRGLNILSMLIKKIFNGEQRLQKKIAFHLISKFG